MSSGLVASMALPAQAVTTGPEANGPQTASIPAVPAGEASAFFTSPEGGLLALPAGLALEDGTVFAPATAALDFDQTTFVAVPTPDGASADDDGRDVTVKAPTTRREARQRASRTVTDGTATARATSGTKTTSTKTTSTKAASKTTSSKSSSSAASTSTGSGLGAQAVAIASRYLGIPYRYGGSKPSTGLDCSGLVQYVYAQLGKKLPRTAAAQAAAVKRIPRSQAKPGDLVLFPGGGHIAIYMGGNSMLDAPHSGTVVQIRKIYSANVSFGRVV